MLFIDFHLLALDCGETTEVLVWLKITRDRKDEQKVGVQKFSILKLEERELLKNDFKELWSRNNGLSKFLIYPLMFPK
jgi:hypothetical protein